MWWVWDAPAWNRVVSGPLDAGGVTKYDAPAVLDLLRGRLDRLAEHLDADPALVNQRFPELDWSVRARVASHCKERRCST